MSAMLCHRDAAALLVTIGGKCPLIFTIILITSITVIVRIYYIDMFKISYNLKYTLAADGDLQCGRILQDDVTQRTLWLHPVKFRFCQILLLIMTWPRCRSPAATRRALLGHRSI